MQVLTMANPRPNPPPSRVRASSGRKNGSPSFPRASGGTPGPQSQIHTVIPWEVTSDEMVIGPAAPAYLRAFRRWLTGIR